MSDVAVRLRRFAGHHLPAVAWAALVAAALGAPGDALAELSDRLSLGPFLDPLFDKIVHFVLFAVLAALAARSFRALDPAGRSARLARWPLSAAFLAAVVYGGTTELLQLGVGGRTAELGDFLADAAGAALAVGLVAALGGRRAQPAAGALDPTGRGAALAAGDAETG